MHRNNNYDSKSSIFSAEYKIPYDSENSRIVEHLEESQQQLEFLKYKLTQVYEKLEDQIKISIQLQHYNEDLNQQIKQLQFKLNLQRTENTKLKDLMKTVLQNRKALEEQVQYTHQRYKKVLAKQKQEHEEQNQHLNKQIVKLKKQIEFIEEQLTIGSKSNQMVHSLKEQNKESEDQIKILQLEIRKLTNEKVTEVSRLRQEIILYQKNMSPIKDFGSRSTHTDTYIQSNKQNYMLQMSQINTPVEESNEEESIGKWKKSKAIERPISMVKSNVVKNEEKIQPRKQKPELSDDQKLTKCQMEKKSIQNRLIKLERMKRHTTDDRNIMQELQIRLYEMDSQISLLKRKIRQKY